MQEFVQPRLSLSLEDAQEYQLESTACPYDGTMRELRALLSDRSFEIIAQRYTKQKDIWPIDPSLMREFQSFMAMLADPDSCTDWNAHPVTASYVRQSGELGHHTGAVVSYENGERNALIFPRIYRCENGDVSHKIELFEQGLNAMTGQLLHSGRMVENSLAHTLVRGITQNAPCPLSEQHPPVKNFSAEYQRMGAQLFYRRHFGPVSWTVLMTNPTEPELRMKRLAQTWQRISGGDIILHAL